MIVYQNGDVIIRWNGNNHFNVFWRRYPVDWFVVDQVYSEEDATEIAADWYANTK